MHPSQSQFLNKPKTNIYVKKYIYMITLEV